MNRIFEFVKFAHPKYIVSNEGNVFNIKTGKMVIKRIIRGYYYVELHDNKIRKNCRLGRLVAKHFIKNPRNLPQVNHIDGDKLNDNVKNLEWVTCSENQLHRISLEKKNLSYKSPIGKRKFTDKKILKVFELRKSGMIHKRIAKKLKMGISTVTHILLGNRRIIR